MPISFIDFAPNKVYTGSEWEVTDEDLLAVLIARVALGQSRHAVKIMAHLAGAQPTPIGGAADAAIKMLTMQGTDPYHRDGWVFQVMSWIATKIQDPDALLSPPQMELAQKGFDGLHLLLSDNDDTVRAAVIYEDKATQNPRTTITSDVWPEFRSFDMGERDNSLLAQTIALLETRPSIDIDAAVQSILWDSVRAYRVAITVGASHSSRAGREALFKGYEKAVSGSKMRVGHTFHAPDIRDFMQRIADSAIQKVKDIEAGIIV